MDLTYVESIFTIKSYPRYFYCQTIWLAGLTLKNILILTTHQVPLVPSPLNSVRDTWWLASWLASTTRQLGLFLIWGWQEHRRVLACSLILNMAIKLPWVTFMMVKLHSFFASSGGPAMCASWWVISKDTLYCISQFPNTLHGYVHTNYLQEIIYKNKIHKGHVFGRMNKQ